jgi:hypothetical protein
MVVLFLAFLHCASSYPSAGGLLWVLRLAGLAHGRISLRSPIKPLPIYCDQVTKNLLK